MRKLINYIEALTEFKTLTYHNYYCCCIEEQETIIKLINSSYKPEDFDLVNQYIDRVVVNDDSLIYDIIKSFYDKRITSINEIEQIFSSEIKEDYNGNELWDSFKLLSDYKLPLIIGARKDMIIGASLQSLLDCGMTREDMVKLRQMGWMSGNNQLEKFV